MTGLPLLRHASLEAPFAYRQGEAVSAAQFLGEAAALAETLPDRAHVINLCRDRYRFALGLAAALLRGQLSLLPPNDTPIMLGQLAESYPDAYGLADGETAGSGLMMHALPEALAPAAVTSVPALAAAQPAVILFTSGSTGQPKPNVKSWGTLVATTLAGCTPLSTTALRGASIVGTVPAQHSYGLKSTVMLALQHGLSLQAERPFFAADIAAALARAPRPRILVTTPIHLRAILAEDLAFPEADLVLSATAPLERTLARQAEARFGCPLMEIFGCSEAGQIATRRPVASENWDCLDGLSLYQDHAGTWVNGTALAEDILLTDAVELLDRTRFRHLGRLGDLVNIAGKRSSLAYLNRQLTAIEGVRDGIFVMPEETSEAQTRLMAFVVAPGLTAETILQALRQRLDPAFLPRPLCLVEALPRNALGKLPREQVQHLVALADAG